MGSARRGLTGWAGLGAGPLFVADDDASDDVSSTWSDWKSLSMPYSRAAGFAKIDETLMSLSAVVLPRSISRSRNASNEPYPFAS
jgi:hypothetical protein